MAKRKGLGAPTKVHASHASSSATAAENHARLALRGSCPMRFTSLEAAINGIGKAWAHAFQSEGRVAKGALSPKTVSTDEARRIYDVDKHVSEAVDRFRRDCVKSNSLDGASRRKRKGR